MTDSHPDPRFVRWAIPTDPGFTDWQQHDGYRLAVAREGGRWRLSSPKSPLRKCRYGTRRPCPNAPAIEFHRSRCGSRNGTWWAYCAEHAYGRWIEGGDVVHLIRLPAGDHSAA